MAASLVINGRSSGDDCLVEGVTVDPDIQGSLQGGGVKQGYLKPQLTVKRRCPLREWLR